MFSLGNAFLGQTVLAGVTGGRFRTLEGPRGLGREWKERAGHKDLESTKDLFVHFAILPVVLG